MNCDECREALSARIDGEDEPVSPRLVDDHLSTCVACARWQDQAISLTRSLRLGPARPGPDLTAAVLAAAGRTDGRLSRWVRPVMPGSRASRQVAARFALAMVGWAQLGLILIELPDGWRLPDRAQGVADHASAAHLFNESIAWNAAIALGMLWAAIQTRRAGGVFAAMLGAVGILIAFSAHDLSTQSVGVPRVATHALLLAGLGLAYAVDRGHQAAPPHPGRPASRMSPRGHVDASAPRGAAVRPLRVHARPRRPASRQHVA